jgi:hypothetical protein
MSIVAKPCGLAAQYGVAFGSCWAGTGDDWIRRYACEWLRSGAAVLYTHGVVYRDIYERRF